MKELQFLEEQKKMMEQIEKEKKGEIYEQTCCKAQIVVK